MEEQVHRLAQKAYARYQTTPSNQRLLIGIAGIPGSGKTTLAELITKSLNELCSPSSPATFVPMDGYHLTRAQLHAMPDPETAVFRRGAAFTFNAGGWSALVHSLCSPILDKIITAPSFDHAIKDPVEDDIEILPSHRIVVMEGNYLALDKEPWRSAAGCFDELWFVDVDEKVAEERLARRHVAAGIVGSYEEGVERAGGNDMVNGREILENRVEGIGEVVVSREDEDWGPDGSAH